MDAAAPAITSSASAMERREIKDMIKRPFSRVPKEWAEEKRRIQSAGQNSKPRKELCYPPRLWNNTGFRLPASLRGGDTIASL